MAKAYDRITDELAAFIQRQRLSFVATAPLSGEGRVNLSPKGLDSLRILSPHRVAFLDVIGSGNETSAHLLENGRIRAQNSALSSPVRAATREKARRPALCISVARWYNQVAQDLLGIDCGLFPAQNAFT